MGNIWSLGHRNVLGLAIDLEGRLWEIEMGPRGGDELNLVKRAANYGYPIVSDGDHYDGREIPDHDTHPEFEKPAVSWNPAISPGDLMIYGGDLFSDWHGDAFAAGLSSHAIVRIELDGVDALTLSVTRWVRGFAPSSRGRTVRSGSWRTTKTRVQDACSNSHRRTDISHFAGASAIKCW